MTYRKATPNDIRRSWLEGRELALLDLSEEDVFAKAHPLFAANLPLSRLELEIFERVPRRDCPIILYDDKDGLTERAAGILTALGYHDIAILPGGIANWRAAGYELFSDVNSPSKAFGELVESELHTPSLPAEQVRAMQSAGADMVILDARPFSEYQVMNIPGALNVPGAELALRAASLAPDPATTIIVNCAGRTRSLIGAQSLRNAGLPNPIFALRNGTIGWTLAGLALERGQQRRADSMADLAAAQKAARALADRAGVRRLGHESLAHWVDDPARTCYRFDMRPDDEFILGHLPGFRPVAGGQLVQETDHFAPVRGARIILYDDLSVRADMTASWLAQMGWEVLVLDPVPVSSLSETGAWLPRMPAPPPVELIEAELLTLKPMLILDFGPSPSYRRGHIPGARFAIRSRLPDELPTILPKGEPVVLLADDENLARFAASDLRQSGYLPKLLIGGRSAWRASALEVGDGAALSAFEDIYRRPYVGTDVDPAAMQAYLDWEFGLVAQLARDGTHGFRVLQLG